LTDEGRVKLDFAIVIGDQRFTLRMTYPKVFHHAARSCPVGHDNRLSAHQ